jgi:inosine-uridine nucleoside N-ribohydrolase
VELESELTGGRTVCDVYGTTGREPNVDVGVDLDVERFWELLIGAIGAYRPG